jgi:hypothetical protein
MQSKRFLLELRQQANRFRAYIFTLFSGLIASWVYISLPTPQALIDLLSINLFSLGTILLTAAVLFILLYFYRRNEVEKFLDQIKKEKNLRKIAENRLAEEIPLIQRRAEKDLEEEKLRIQRKAEKDVSEFVCDIFESDIDDILIKIVEDSLKVYGVNRGLLYILHKLSHGYFEFNVADITLYRPDNLGTNLLPVVSVPPMNLEANVKGDLTFYIGNDNENFDDYDIGLAGFSYKHKEFIKIFLDEERHAFRVHQNELNQLIEEPFPYYRAIGIHEQIYTHSIAAIPLYRNQNRQTNILGVLCICNSDEETFKSQKHDEQLTKAARCVAISIEIQDLLSKLY